MRQVNTKRHESDTGVVVGERWFWGISDHLSAALYGRMCLHVCVCVYVHVRAPRCVCRRLHADISRAQTRFRGPNKERKYTWPLLSCAWSPVLRCLCPCLLSSSTFTFVVLLVCRPTSPASYTRARMPNLSARTRSETSAPHCFEERRIGQPRSLEDGGTPSTSHTRCIRSTAAHYVARRQTKDPIVETTRKCQR